MRRNFVIFWRTGQNVSDFSTEKIAKSFFLEEIIRTFTLILNCHQKFFAFCFLLFFNRDLESPRSELKHEYPI